MDETGKKAQRACDHATAIAMKVIELVAEGALKAGYKKEAVDQVRLVGPTVVDASIELAKEEWVCDPSRPVNELGLELFDLAARLGIEQALEGGLGF